MVFRVVVIKKININIIKVIKEIIQIIKDNNKEIIREIIKLIMKKMIIELK